MVLAVLLGVVLISVLGAGLSGRVSWELRWTVAGNGALFFFASLIIGVLVSPYFGNGNSLRRAAQGVLISIAIGTPILVTAYLFTVAPAIVLVPNELMPTLQVGILVVMTAIGYVAGITRETDADAADIQRSET